jgi:hypothetical protein
MSGGNVWVHRVGSWHHIQKTWQLKHVGSGVNDLHIRSAAVLLGFISLSSLGCLKVFTGSGQRAKPRQRSTEKRGNGRSQLATGYYDGGHGNDPHIRYSYCSFASLQLLLSSVHLVCLCGSLLLPLPSDTHTPTHNNVHTPGDGSGLSLPAPLKLPSIAPNYLRYLVKMTFRASF